MQEASKIDKGDIIICNDVVGMVIDNLPKTFSVITKEGNTVELRKSANILLIANSFSIATLMYKKILQKRKGA